MSMHNLTRNLDADTHKVAQRQALLAGFDAKHLAGVDKAALHGIAKQKRGPEGECLSTLHYFGALAESEGIGPTDAERKEAETHWLRTFKCDPAIEPVRAEKIKEYAKNRWALEETMKDSGVNVRGPMPSTVNKAFTTNSTLVIFPFYWDTGIQAGMLAMPMIDRLIMADIPINSFSADHAEMTDTDSKSGITLGAEGVPPSEALLTATNRTIKTTKLEYLAKASYEALQYSRLPIFEKFLMRVGQRLMIMITDLGIERLIAGDGASAAATTVAAIVSGTASYLDLLKLEEAFTMGYDPDVLVVTRESKRDILAFPQYQDPQAGVLHQTTGRSPSPLGWEMLRWDYTGRASSYATAGVAGSRVIVGQAGEMMIKYTAGGVLTETEKIIRGQWNVVAVSTHTDYGIWDRAACRVGTAWRS